MKKVTAFFSLLVTAILCFCLVSCDRDETSREALTSVEQTDEKTATLPEDTTYFEEISSEKALKTESGATAPMGSPVTTESTVTVTATDATVKTTANQTTAQPSTTVAATVPVTETTVATTAAATTATATTEPTTVAITSQADTTLVVTDTEDKHVELAVVDLVNKERTAAGLDKLTVSDELTEAANIRAKEIVECFAHVRPDGTLWNTVSELAMGENIAYGYNTPQSVMNSWMNSEGHRNNILTKRYTTIGVGCYYDSASNTYYWVQLFG